MTFFGFVVVEEKTIAATTGGHRGVVCAKELLLVFYDRDANTIEEDESRSLLVL